MERHCSIERNFPLDRKRECVIVSKTFRLEQSVAFMFQLKFPDIFALWKAKSVSRQNFNILRFSSHEARQQSTLLKQV